MKNRKYYYWRDVTGYDKIFIGSYRCVLFRDGIEDEVLLQRRSGENRWNSFGLLSNDLDTSQLISFSWKTKELGIVAIEDVLELNCYSKLEDKLINLL